MEAVIVNGPALESVLVLAICRRAREAVEASDGQPSLWTEAVNGSS
jgi:hypothetical protein